MIISRITRPLSRSRSLLNGCGRSEAIRETLTRSTQINGNSDGFDRGLGFLRGYLTSIGIGRGFVKSSHFSDIKYALANPRLHRLFSSEAPKRKNYENFYTKEKKEIPKGDEQKSESKDDLNTNGHGNFQETFVKQFQILINPLLVIGLFLSSFSFGLGEQKQHIEILLPAVLLLWRHIRSFCTSAANRDLIPFLESYTVTPPIKPWPQRLYSKRLVSMITRQQNLDLALQIFHYAGKFHPGFSHNYDTYHAIIRRLSRAREFEAVEALLLQLHNSRIKCGEELFITVIRNYGLASRPKLALRTFLRIESFEIKRSVRSLNTLLNALVQNKQYNLVHLIFKNSKTKFGVIPNVFTCNILIKALCRKNDVEGAIRVLDEIPSMGMIPNVVTYTTILGGYVSRGDMDGGKRIFGEILYSGWLPDATTYTILMDGYCKQGRLIDAIKLMDDMEENGVEPNDVTYGVMIEAYAKAKKSGEALKLLDDMLDKRYIPSSALCCRVIDLLCEEGKVDDACAMWKRLLRKNCTPDNAISSTLIHWLCKKGMIWEARKMFDDFERGSIPSLLTYNTLIAGLCERGELSEAARLWDNMLEKGCAPNCFTYSMLIKGFCKVGNAKEGIRIVDEMLEKGCLPDKSTYSILIEGLSDSGMEGEITEVLAKAMSNGVDNDTWVLFLTKIVGNLDSSVEYLNRILSEDVI